MLTFNIIIHYKYSIREIIFIFQHMSVDQLKFHAQLGMKKVLRQ